MKARPKMNVGKASGKRTLTDVMDADLERKRPKLLHSPRKAKNSRFFAPSMDVDMQVASSSKLTLEHKSTGEEEKENIFTTDDDSNASLLVHGAGFEEQVLDDAEFGVVEQEEGYMSTSSLDRDTPELSSPIRRNGDYSEDDEDYVAAISSPVDSRCQDHNSDLKSIMKQFMYQPPPPPFPVTSVISSNHIDIGEVLINSTPTPSPQRPTSARAVDFSDVFRGEEREGAYSVDCGADRLQLDPGPSSPPFTPSPQTPDDDEPCTRVSTSWGDCDDELSDPEEREVRLSAKRHADVANGWKRQYSHVQFPALPPPLASRRSTMVPQTLNRRETNVTPHGRQNLSGLHSFSNSGPVRSRDTLAPRSTLRQLTHAKNMKPKPVGLERLMPSSSSAFETPPQ